jgi:hypothetical protein
MTYKFWRAYYRVAYWFHFLPRRWMLNLAIARESARWVAIRFASFTLGLT